MPTGLHVRGPTELHEQPRTIRHQHLIGPGLDTLTKKRIPKLLNAGSEFRRRQIVDAHPQDGLAVSAQQ